MCRGGRGKESNRRTDFTAVGGKAKVLQQRLKDILGCREMAHVTHRQRLPMETPDTTSVITPGHPGSIGQFRNGLPVCATFSNLSLNLTQPPTLLLGKTALGVEKLEIIAGFLQQFFLLRIP